MQDNATLAQTYADAGFVFPVEGVPEAEAQACLAALEQFECANDARIESAWRARLFELHLLLPEFDALVRSPPVLAAVEQILGPDLLVWECNIFLKEPHSESFVSWHQDLHYLGLGADDQVNAWIALTDVTVANGCMRMMRGSHLQGDVGHRDTYAVDNVLTRGQVVEAAIDEADATNVTLSAGQASLHHGHVFHASGPNRTDERRIGVAIRYIRTSARQTLIEDDCAVLVSGTDQYGHSDLLDPPSPDMDDATVARFGHARNMREQIYFEGAR